MNLVILSRSTSLYSTNALVQAAKRRKHHVQVIDPTECDIIIQDGTPLVYYDNKPIRNIDAILPRIGYSITFYGVPIVKQFEMMGIFTTASAEAISQSKDKLRTTQQFSKFKIATPKTVFAHPLRNPKQLLDNLGGQSFIIKLLEGTQGIGVILAPNISSAISIIETLNSTNTKFIIQEYIEEAEGIDIRIFVIEDQIVGAIKRQAKAGEFRSNLHRGGTATVIQLSEDEKNIALKATKALGLAIAGVDLLRSKKGPLVLEVNSSPGLEGIELTTKKDIATSIIRYIEKNI